MPKAVDWPREFKLVKAGAERKALYDRYLASAHWKEQRAAALERAENSCQVCCRSKRLQVHHRTYERVGAERPADLIVLCAQCHSLFHDKGSWGKPSRPKKKRRRGGRQGRALTPKISQMIDLLEQHVPPGTYTIAEIADLTGMNRSAAGARMDVLRRQQKHRVNRIGKSRFVIKHPKTVAVMKRSQELDRELDDRLAA